MKREMPTRIAAADARNNFADILGRAYFGGEAFLIEKQGKPYAVVLGVDEYRRLLECTNGAVPALEPGPEEAKGGPPG
jgi:prevent-host-death family protein